MIHILDRNLRKDRMFAHIDLHLPHSKVYGRANAIGPSFLRLAGGWDGRWLLNICWVPLCLLRVEREELIPTISKCVFLSHM